MRVLGLIHVYVDFEFKMNVTLWFKFEWCALHSTDACTGHSTAHTAHTANTSMTQLILHSFAFFLLLVMAYLLSHLSKRLTVLSVGSGMGVEEQLLVDHGYAVVCIDPSKAKKDPYLPGKRRVRAPDYPSVPVYLEAHPEYDGGVQLLLHYPLPDYVMYDFLAIQDLRPKCVTVMASMGGSSGSFLLHVWLRQCGVGTFGKLRSEQRHIGDPRVVVSTPYQRVKFELLPDCGNVEFNADGVPQTSFVATLMREGPYVRPHLIMSPSWKEEINQGGGDSINELMKNLAWLVAKFRDDERDEEHDLAVWMEEYRNNVSQQVPHVNALLDANVPGWRTGDPIGGPWPQRRVENN